MGFSKYEWHRCLLDDPDLTDTTKLVALAVWDEASRDGTRAFPGVARIAARLDKTERCVQTCLARLRAAGWLTRTAQAVPRRGYADVYRLSYPDPITGTGVHPNAGSGERPSDFRRTATSWPGEPAFAPLEDGLEDEHHASPLDSARSRASDTRPLDSWDLF